MAELRRGAEAAEQASKFTGGDFARFFKLDDGKSAVVRFLTDAEPDAESKGGWLTVDQHQNIPTKGAPKGHDGQWPDHMPAVCRYDQGLDHPDCYICDVMRPQNAQIKRPSARTWALAVMREEITRDGQRGWKDATRKVTRKEGDKDVEKEVRDVVVVNMGTRNFFSILRGYAAHYGTVLDRDYKITRKGDGLDTTYSIIPMDPVPTKDGSTFDIRNPEHAKRYEPDGVSLDDQLVKVIMDRASDEYFKHWFIHQEGDEEQATTTPAAPSGDAPANTGIANIQARLRGDKPEEEQQQGNGAPAAATPSPAGAGGAVAYDD